MLTESTRLKYRPRTFEQADPQQLRDVGELWHVATRLPHGAHVRCVSCRAHHRAKVLSTFEPPEAPERVYIAPICDHCHAAIGDGDQRVMFDGLKRCRQQARFATRIARAEVWVWPPRSKA